MCAVTIDASVAAPIAEDEDVAYSTREFDGSFVVHLITADVELGVDVSEEITGGVVSAAAEGFTITLAVAYLAVFATLVARTVTVCREAIDAGAL